MTQTQLTLVGEPDEPPPTHVYFATNGVYIKIGHTGSLRRRGGELKSWIIYSEPGALLEERRYQKMWSKYQIGDSEWFRTGDELLLWLQLKITHRTSDRAQALLNMLIVNAKRKGRAA